MELDIRTKTACLDSTIICMFCVNIHEKQVNKSMKNPVRSLSILNTQDTNAYKRPNECKVTLLVNGRSSKALRFP